MARKAWSWPSTTGWLASLAASACFRTVAAPGRGHRPDRGRATGQGPGAEYRPSHPVPRLSRTQGAAIAEHGASSGSVVVVDADRRSAGNGEPAELQPEPARSPARLHRAQPRRHRCVRARLHDQAVHRGRGAGERQVHRGHQGGHHAGADRDRHLPGQGHPQLRAARCHRHHHQVEHVGSIKLGREIDSEAHYDVLRRFGFGAITGSGFPGESPGVLPTTAAGARWRRRRCPTATACR